jgi:hypothetical protein
MTENETVPVFDIWVGGDIFQSNSGRGCISFSVHVLKN